MAAFLPDIEHQAKDRNGRQAGMGESKIYFLVASRMSLWALKLNDQPQEILHLALEIPLLRPYY